jgi:Uncharacterized protein conserved in bacteria
MSSIVDTPHSHLPQPKSGWQLFKSLASGTITPGLAWQNPSYRRKFVLRSLATPFNTARLLASLAKQPRLMQMLHERAAGVLDGNRADELQSDEHSGCR